VLSRKPSKFVFVFILPIGAHIFPGAAARAQDVFSSGDQPGVQSQPQGEVYGGGNSRPTGTPTGTQGVVGNPFCSPPTIVVNGVPTQPLNWSCATRQQPIMPNVQMQQVLRAQGCAVDVNGAITCPSRVAGHGRRCRVTNGGIACNTSDTPPADEGVTTRAVPQRPKGIQVTRDTGRPGFKEPTDQRLIDGINACFSRHMPFSSADPFILFANFRRASVASAPVENLRAGWTGEPLLPVSLYPPDSMWLKNGDPNPQPSVTAHR
jgi:hypothetical protein